MTTTSGFSILDGSCDISGTTVSNYNSTSNGIGTVSMLPAIPGYTLHFRVTFTAVGSPPVTPTFVIKANADGSNYSGQANNGQKRQDENWAATAVEPAVAAKAN
jgi:hypothetical protein